MRRALLYMMASYMAISHLKGSLPETGTPQGAGNIYGLRVYYHLVSISPTEQEVVLDVERTFNSDPHYLQRALNYLESWWGYFLQRPYHLEIEALYTMLTLMIGRDILQQTTDHLFLTNAWHAYEAWNDRLTPGVLRPFREVFPFVKRIQLQTISGRRVVLTSSSRLMLQEFKGMGIGISTTSKIGQPLKKEKLG